MTREDCRFIDVSVGVPGRVHDARALRKSALWETGLQKCGHGQYLLLADAAFPIQRWTMTRYRNSHHLTQQQTLYNHVLSSKRQVVERSFGLLKRRFRRLKYGLHIIDIEELNSLILAVCCLHNLCILWDTDADFDDEEDNRIVPNFAQPLNFVGPQNAHAEGQLRRIQITNNL